MKRIPAYAKSAIKSSTVVGTDRLELFQELLSVLGQSSIRNLPASGEVSAALGDVAQQPTKGNIEKLKAAIGSLKNTLGISAELAAKADAVLRILKGWVGA